MNDGNDRPAGVAAPSLTPLATLAHGGTGVLVAVDPAVVSPALRDLIAGGGYEAGEANLVSRLVEPGDCVLELGAGLGFIAALVGMRCHPRRYIAVEADPRLPPLIAATLRANGVAVARIVSGILTNDAAKLAAGSVPFRIEAHFWGSHEVSAETAGARPVPVQSLDAVLAGEGVTVMIVDVEGGEAGLFEGANLAGVRAIFVETHADRIGSGGYARLFATLTAAGLIYDPALSQGYLLTFRRW